jgi:hypothetical protein
VCRTHALTGLNIKNARKREPKSKTFVPHELFALSNPSERLAASEFDAGMSKNSVSWRRANDIVRIFARQ